MTEILFRGKGNKKYNDGDWYYGVPIQCSDGDWQICTDCSARTVITETIGQYTGLTDKNGKKIFEGDIVKHDFGKEQIGVQYAVVEFDSKYASFLINPLDDWMFCCDKSDCEVVGNIHDNHELLRGV